jgi:hypothetical protein
MVKGGDDGCRQGEEEVNGGGPAFDKPNKKQINKIKYKQQKYEIIKIIIVIEIIIN